MQPSGRGPRGEGVSRTETATAVTVGDGAVTADDIVSVADGSTVALGPGALARIRDSRAVIDAALASERPVYGLNTGVGHNKDTRLPDDALREMQRMLLVTHSGGIGDPAPVEVVRAAMFVRVVGMSRGGSGRAPRPLTS
jgi:histidine ammonia-lyase